MRVYDLFLKGGPTMWPMLGLSVATIACALERSWFWFQLLTKEDRIVREVLDAARYNLAKAAEIAAYSQTLAIGRFLLAPLQLKQPTPETFRLAMESAGDKEFMQMRKGDKLLETVVAIAPLLGLLGTVTGLIVTFNNLNIGGGGGSVEAGKAAAGIGEALITTAAGMIVAIIALSIYRVLVVFQARQVDYFYAAGSELELIYRQVWYEPLTNPGERSPYSTPTAPPSDSPVRAAGVSGRWSVQWMVDGADAEGQNIQSGASSLPSDYQNGGEELTRPVTKTNTTFES
jgi:biopolymer transport protein ExbB